jgi:hypothetical protein
MAQRLDDVPNFVVPLDDVPNFVVPLDDVPFFVVFRLEWQVQFPGVEHHIIVRLPREEREKQIESINPNFVVPIDDVPNFVVPLDDVSKLSWVEVKCRHVSRCCKVIVYTCSLLEIVVVCVSFVSFVLSFRCRSLAKRCLRKAVVARLVTVMSRSI